MKSLTILHTNDLHNKLMDAQAERIRAEREALGGHGLLLDAGDAVGSGNATFRPDGEPILDVLSSIGYDAMAVGNREFHFTRIGFHAKARRARFPLLSANLRSRSPGVPVPCAASVSFEIAGGCNVCVFGLTVPMITERMKVRHLSPYIFDDPIQTARGLVESAREHYDLIVALSHCGLAVDRKLAAEVSGLDVIIGGHSHAVLPNGEAVGATMIAHAGSHAHWLGRLTVSGDRGDWHSTAELVPL